MPYFSQLLQRTRRNLQSVTHSYSAIPPPYILWGLGGCQGSRFNKKKKVPISSGPKWNQWLTPLLLRGQPTLSNGLAGTYWFSIYQPSVNSPISGAIRVVSNWGCLFLASPGYTRTGRVLLVYSHARSPPEIQRYGNQLLADMSSALGSMDPGSWQER